MIKESETFQSARPQKIGFVHLGCPKNLVDTENMLGLLHQAGHQVVGDEADADVMLVNTCSFIDKAQEESVRNLVHLAAEGKQIVITGCLAQKYQGELMNLIPEAKALVGTGDLGKIVEVVEQVSQGERVISITQDPTYILEDDSQRMHITVGSYVYLKIAEGCDYRCSFCIIPSMRGDFRSRSLDSIVEDAKRYAQKGVSELILVGQDTTSYGKDFGSNLPQLLRALNKVDGIQWIRFMYAYPNLVSDALLDTIAECDKLVKYLDCPLQHMHPEILRSMRRPVMDHVQFAERVRERVPEVRLRTGLIVGFPGETEAHFDFLMESIQAVAFDRLGVFEYSDVEGAYSKGLEGKVPKSEIKRRRKALMEIQQGISLEKNRTLIGQTLEVLVDTADPDKNCFEGRTQWDAPEIDNRVLGKGPVVPGEIVPVTIKSATPYDLKGTLNLCDGEDF
jgi:ribosomal protein S12 methylthiotransferase